MTPTTLSAPARPRAAASSAPIAQPAATPLGGAALAAVAYLMAVGAAFAAWLAPWTTPAAVALGWGGFVPAALALGFALAPAPERRHQVARLLAVVMMAPVLLLFLHVDGQAGWNVGTVTAVGGVALHTACFLAAVMWLGKETTRLQPASGVPRVEARLLRQRLLSLPALGLKVKLHTSFDGTVHLRWHPAGAEARLHTVRLRIRDDLGEVEVREGLRARGAAPLDADEASMRRVGDPSIDPVRPDAQRVWSQTVQSTILEPGQVAAVPVIVDGPQVRWLGAQPPALPDTDTLMALLAAVVLRSGHVWAPRLGR